MKFLTNKYFLITTAIAVVLLVVYVVWSKEINSFLGIGSAKGNGISDKTKPTERETPSAQQPLNKDKNLYFEVDKPKRVPEVKALQIRLNQKSSKFGKKLSVDGLFGLKTKAALKAVKGVEETTLNAYDSMTDVAFNDAVKSPTSDLTAFEPQQEAMA